MVIFEYLQISVAIENTFYDFGVLASVLFSAKHISSYSELEYQSLHLDIIYKHPWYILCGQTDLAWHGNLFLRLWTRAIWIHLYRENEMSVNNKNNFVTSARHEGLSCKSRRLSYNRMP